VKKKLGPHSLQILVTNSWKWLWIQGFQLRLPETYSCSTLRKPREYNAVDAAIYGYAVEEE